MTKLLKFSIPCIWDLMPLKCRVPTSSNFIIFVVTMTHLIHRTIGGSEASRILSCPALLSPVLRRPKTSLEHSWLGQLREREVAELFSGQQRSSPLSQFYTNTTQFIKTKQRILLVLDFATVIKISCEVRLRHFTFNPEKSINNTCSLLLGTMPFNKYNQ